MANLNELIRKMITGEIPPAPVAKLIGFNILEAGNGKAVFSMQAGPAHANPMGTLHGGILCDIADAAMGIAYATLLKDDESFTTIELKINYFRPVWNSELLATAHVVGTGRTLGMVECEVSDDKGHLVAKASSTCMTLRGAEAARR